MASGTAPLTYQWLFSKTNAFGIVTSTDAILNVLAWPAITVQPLTNTAAPTNAIYFVVVTNLYGSVTSSNCVLTVDAPPTF